MEINKDVLKEVLFWLSGVGAMVATYWLMERVAYLRDLEAKWKRIASLALAGIIAIGAYCATIGLTYSPTPIGWQDWLETLFAVAFVAVFGSQTLHGLLKLE